MFANAIQKISIDSVPIMYNSSFLFLICRSYKLSDFIYKNRKRHRKDCHSVPALHRDRPLVERDDPLGDGEVQPTCNKGMVVI